MTELMECQCIAPGRFPRQSLLYTTYLNDASRLREFFPHTPDEEGIRHAASEVRYDAVTRTAVAQILREQNERFGSAPATFRNLERFSSGAYTVVAGQQVGLFTGPSYSIYKALTAIRVAQEMTARGVPAVPVFWMATQDHDLAEIQRTYFLGPGQLEALELVPGADSAGRRVGEIPLGANIEEIVARARTLLDGPGADSVARALADSYAPKETFGSAFGKLLARIFPEEGMILLDPLHPGLQRLAAPIYLRAVEDHATLARELQARSKQLQKSRYHVQVKVIESGTQLFVNVDGRRQPLRRRNHDFFAGDAQFPAGEIPGAITSRPEDFSANALLRPVVQDSLLPTAAFIAGPAEISYLAQSQVLYHHLLGRMPAVLPRASFTLVEARHERLLQKYGLSLLDLAGGRQHLRAAMERKFLPRALAVRFEAGEKSIHRLLSGLRRPLGKLDPTLLGAADTAERKMLYQLGRLRSKAARAENLRTGVLDAHERQLLDALYPHHALQERALCFLPFLARHGSALMDELSRHSSIGATQHQVLFL